ncbi:MAG: hypothetical protein JWP35_1967 [Caulobacter sp.]|nr:hypothetical protein [Caulobacter sp.]
MNAKPLLLIAAIGLMAAGDPKAAIMDSIERQARLPDGALAVEKYERHYAYMGDGTVIGIYVSLDGDDVPGRTWGSTKQLPQISDGGCGVVTVFYDPKTKKVTDTRCNFTE